MKLWPFLTTIPIVAMLLSCNNSPAHLNEQGLNKLEWSIGGVLPYDIENHPSVGLAGPVTGINNEVLFIGGGSNFQGTPPWEGGQKKYYKQMYAYRKRGDSLRLVKDDLELPGNLAYSANCSTAKGIVVAGGENEKGTTRQVLLLRWDDPAQNMTITNLPDLPEPLSNGAIAADKDMVYYGGGQNGATTSDRLYALDLNDTTRGWQALPPLSKPVAYATLYVASDGENNCLYLVGGRKSNIDSTSDLYSEVYQFNLSSRKWTQKTSLPAVLSAQTGLCYGDHTLLVFSGDRGETFHKTEVLLMQIAKEKDTVIKERLIKEKNKLQENHPGFTREVLAYNTSKDNWTKLGTIPFPGQVTSTALLWQDEIIIPCGEIKAGVRSANIIIGQIKKKATL